MITKDTVFVLGTGASAPYGYPVGTGLTDDICLDFISDIARLAAKGPNNIVLELMEGASEFVDKFRRSRNTIHSEPVRPIRPGRR